MTQTVYMGGLLVGSVAFSALSDHVGRKIVAFLSIFFLVSIARCKDVNLASENSRHLVTPPLVSLRNDVRETNAEIPY